MENQVAAKIFLLNKSIKSSNLKMLNILQLTKGMDVSKVITAYSRILDKDLEIARIVSSIELSSKQKEQLQAKIGKKFQGIDIVYVFEKDGNVEKGLEVVVGDNYIDFT